MAVVFLAASILLLDWASPVIPRSGSVTAAYGIYSVFYLLFVVTHGVIVASIIPFRASMTSVTPTALPAGIYSVMVIACWASTAGLLFLIGDRVIYQNVDFINDSFVVTRARLNASRSEAGGVSSLFSVAGNLLQFCYFFTLTMGVYYYELLSQAQRFRLAAWIALIAIAGSYVLGGRSILSLAALAVCATWTARIVAGRASYSSMLSRRAVIRCGIGVGLTLMAMLYVFYARANASALSSQKYLETFIAHLGGEVTQTYRACEAGILCDIYNYAQLTVLYITHGLWVLAESYYHPDALPSMAPLLGGVLSIYSKIDAVGGQVAIYQFSGLFNSLPGSIFYIFGGGGVLFFSVLLGVVTGLSALYLHRSASVVAVLAYVLVCVTMLISPVLSAFNAVMFVFIVLSMLTMVALLFIVQYLRGERRIS
ncbi:hypothetical protein [Pseudomonas sp. nanlin1]|uniref:hypothetical protein n=1 Tax=Pseudomonas sp. nanlin1 TaxID=3040605 RepID=UPI00388FAC92